MNFYTLEYDCNTPVTQQINVPTNTDYKIGMKVKRNGEVQRLSPSDFTITDTDGNTLSVDSDKTNSYVTITKASGDEATFKQFRVAVDADKTYAVNEYVGTQQGPNNGPLVVMDIDLSPLAGTTITPDQLFLAVKQGTNAATEPASREQLEALLVPYMQSSLPNIHWALGDGSRLVNPSGKQIMFYDSMVMKTNFNYFGWKEGDAPIFLVNNVGEATLYTQTSFTIENGAHLIFRNNALAANRYVAALFALLPQEAFRANFKLNINEFKSQKGDINLIGRASTVNFAGTDGQGKAFSYDVIVK